MVYTKDHDVIPKLCKICDRLLNSSSYHFDLHQGKNVKVNMECEVPKRHIFNSYIIHLHGPMGCAVGKKQKGCYGRKRQGPMTQKYCYNNLLMKLFVGKRRWRKEKKKKWSNLKFPFVDLYWKNKHLHFSGAWSSQIRFTHGKGPICFVKRFFNKSDHESWTIKSDHGERPSSMVRFMVHDVNRP